MAPAERVPYHHEYNYLESLGRIDKRSRERMENAGIFKDLNAKQIGIIANYHAIRRDITLRKGWKGCFFSAVKPASRAPSIQPPGQVHIVSVAWSGHFIRSYLSRFQESFLERRQGWFFVPQVHANEITDTTGLIEGGIHTAGDKLTVMRRTISDYRNQNHGRRPVSVYVGDSATDLTCILAADVGIIMQDKVLTSEQVYLYDTLLRLSYEIRHVLEYADMRPHLGPDVKIVWAAGDFEQIRQSMAVSGEGRST